MSRKAVSGQAQHFAAGGQQMRIGAILQQASVQAVLK
jgi:hypothetical protein